MTGETRAALGRGRFAGLPCRTRLQQVASILGSVLVTMLVTTPCCAQDEHPASNDVPDTTASTSPSPVEKPAEALSPVGDDGLPNPAYWMFDEEGHARDWLDKQPMDPADLRARLPEYEATLDDHGIFLDLEANELFVRGATIHDARSLSYPIEYLVVTELGRTYEALVIVKAQPSVLSACLRAMGAEPGGPTVLELKDPLPPEEDLDAGRESAWMVEPPHGPLLHLTMEWLDDGGRQHAPSLESLLIDARDGKPLEELGWIFTGGAYGEYRQGRDKKRRFKADVEGDVVAIYLAGLEVCVFERNSLDGLIDGYYFPHPERMPAPNTPITLRFKLLDESVPQREPFSAPSPEEVEARYAAELEAVTAAGEEETPDGTEAADPGAADIDAGAETPDDGADEG